MGSQDRTVHSSVQRQMHCGAQRQSPACPSKRLLCPHQGTLWWLSSSGLSQGKSGRAPDCAQDSSSVTAASWRGIGPSASPSSSLQFPISSSPSLPPYPGLPRISAGLARTDPLSTALTALCSSSPGILASALRRDRCVCTQEPREESSYVRYTREQYDYCTVQYQEPREESSSVRYTREQCDFCAVHYRELSAAQ